MSLAAAIARVETWTFTGLTSNIAYTVRTPPSEDKLPALVLELGYSYEGMKSIAVNFLTGAAIIQPDHLLLVCSANQSDETRLSTCVGLIDLYWAKVADDMRLNANLMEPLALLTTDIGIVRFMGALFFGVRFKHRWVFKVT